MIIKKYQDLTFELNPGDLTAKVIRSPEARGKIMIPHSVFHETQEYIVKSIGEKSFKGNFFLYAIDFPENSEVKIIEKKAFFGNDMNTIYIPSSLEILENDWCRATFNVNTISISPYNKNYKFLNEENKVIIGKSNLESDDFDVLVFASRDISYIRIPSYIKYISPYCFEGCLKLQTVEFEDNSKLISIGTEAFRCSSIKSIFIPSKVEKLMDGCLLSNEKLTNITISPENPNFRYLDKEKKIIIGKSDSNNDIFDTIIVSCYDVSISIIPSTIKYIAPCAFEKCYNLKTIKFDTNSQIEQIGKCAFLNSSLEYISIPSSVKIIENSAFFACDNIKTVFFPEDSKLRSFSKKLFFDSSIETINIPPSVEDFDGYFCNNNCRSNLTKILISPQNKLFKYLDQKCQIVVTKSNKNSSEFDSIVWASPNLIKTHIPFYIKHICPFAFTCCKRLQNITFDKNSQLISIQKEAFSDCRSLQHIDIPSSVKIIGKRAFFRCEQLRYAIIQNDSELISIGTDAFLQTRFVFVDISSHLQKIVINNFRGLNIKILRMTPNPELKSIGYRAFYGSHIQGFEIPSHFQFFEDGWCKNTPCLHAVFISPENKNFKYLDKDKKLIISKSDLSKDTFDVLEFASRDITSAFIPSSIKYIRPFCFERCKTLKSIQFEQNSQLISIGSDAFNETAIQSFIMPPNVKEINSFTFSQCSLKNIIFDDKSELQPIHQGSFSQSKIENISIPSNVTDIFYCAFSSCKNLKKLNIPENSRLKFIDSYAFGNSSIEDLYIPANLIELRERWCQNTPKLVDIKLSPENKEYKYLDNDRKMIIGKSNKNSEDFDILVFACRDITQAFIPSYIKRICSFCFEDCNNLKKVEFEKKSLLVSFGTGAFKSSQIESILIPSHVKRIEKSCFENCRNLMNIEFEENSELLLIDKYAIKGTKISEKSIPSNVKIDLTEY